MDSGRLLAWISQALASMLLMQKLLDGSSSRAFAASKGLDGDTLEKAGRSLFLFVLVGVFGYARLNPLLEKLIFI
jgi:hypothetical protein